MGHNVQLAAAAALLLNFILFRKPRRTETQDLSAYLLKKLQSKGLSSQKHNLLWTNHRSMVWIPGCYEGSANSAEGVWKWVWQAVLVSRSWISLLPSCMYLCLSVKGALKQEKHVEWDRTYRRCIETVRVSVGGGHGHFSTLLPPSTKPSGMGGHPGHEASTLHILMAGNSTQAAAQKQEPLEVSL